MYVLAYVIGLCAFLLYGLVLNAKDKREGKPDFSLGVFIGALLWPLATCILLFYWIEDKVRAHKTSVYLNKQC